MTKMEIDQMMRSLPSQRAYYAETSAEKALACVAMTILAVLLVMI